MVVGWKPHGNSMSSTNDAFCSSSRQMLRVLMAVAARWLHTLCLSSKSSLKKSLGSEALCLPPHCTSTNRKIAWLRDLFKKLLWIQTNKLSSTAVFILSTYEEKLQPSPLLKTPQDVLYSLFLILLFKIWNPWQLFLLWQNSDIKLTTLIIFLVTLCGSELHDLLHHTSSPELFHLSKTETFWPYNTNCSFLPDQLWQPLFDFWSLS